MNGAAQTRLDPDRLAALEDQRAFLLASLDDLDREHDAGDLDDDDYETLKADYTVRAARVLHEIEDHHQASEDVAPGQRGWRRFIAVAAVAVVAVVGGVVVTSVSGGDSSTGSGAAGELTPSKATQACMDKLTTAFAPAAKGAANPNGVTSAISALDCFSERISAEPGDAVAYTYRGWAQALMARTYGSALPADSVTKLTKLARSDLAKARSLAPSYPDPLAFSAILALWNGDLPTAKADLAKVDALQLPANAPILGYVNGMLRPALKAAETLPSTTTATGTTVPGAATSVPSTTAPAAG